MTLAPAPSAEEAAAAEFLAGLGFVIDPVTGGLSFGDRGIEKIRELVNSDTPEGYALFYSFIFNRPIPAHALKWIEFIYDKCKIVVADDGGKIRKPIIIEAFRGSTKTTTVTVGFVAYQIGLHPERDNIIIQVGDEIANINSEQISKIIEFNPCWKLLFPNVVPDPARGWGAEGYEVKRIDMDYGEWTRQRSKDPTLVACGYTSSSIVSKHPSGVLLVDDIHDEKNTASARELQTVITTYNGTIKPLSRPNVPYHIMACTPWVKGDVADACKATGEYAVMKTPVYDENGNPNWPEMMPRSVVEQIEREDTTGGVEPARMYHLDLEKKAKKVFTYHTYPNHLIRWDWPYVGGVDYAGVADPTKRNRQQSHFAIAYVAKLPEGGAVVFDGVLEQCSQAESEDYMKKAQNLFPSWEFSVIEGDGKGEEFFQLMIRHPGFKAVMQKTGGKSKAERLVKQLGPWLKNGRLKISDRDDSFFLSSLKKFLREYPAVGEHDPGWDAADAVYWAARGMPDALKMPASSDELPTTIQRPKTKHPYLAIIQGA